MKMKPIEDQKTPDDQKDLNKTILTRPILRDTAIHNEEQRNMQNNNAEKLKKRKNEMFAKEALVTLLNNAFNCLPIMLIIYMTMLPTDYTGSLSKDVIGQTNGNVPKSTIAVKDNYANEVPTTPSNLFTENLWTTFPDTGPVLYEEDEYTDVTWLK